jgi:hypothetical protein
VSNGKCEWPGCLNEAAFRLDLVYLGEVKSCVKHEDVFFALNGQLHQQRRNTPREIN